jgi:hypothetical protein
MKEKPLRVDPFAPIENVERVATMLDRLAKMGLCRRTLEGLNRVYSITPDGLAAICANEGSANIYPGGECSTGPDVATAQQSAAE